MKLFVLAAAALVAFVGVAKSDTPQFFLKPDGTVEQRVAKVESDVSALQARIDALEKQLGTVATAAPATKPKASAKVRYSVCVGGRCTIYEADAGSPIPAGAVLMAGDATSTAAGSPCPTGGCGDACGCVSASASSGGDGWYLGKRLGRRR